MLFHVMKETKICGNRKLGFEVLGIGFTYHRGFWFVGDFGFCIFDWKCKVVGADAVLWTEVGVCQY